MRYSILAVYVLATLATRDPALAAGDPCLEYEPMVVTLTGTITRHMNYGPPNYGEDPAHDIKERYWRLDLDKPICVEGKDEDPTDRQGEQNVRHLHIVYHNYPTGDWVGHHVSITGTLYHFHTGHHHTRVLIAATKTTRLP